MIVNNDATPFLDFGLRRTLLITVKLIDQKKNFGKNIFLGMSKSLLFVKVSKKKRYVLIFNKPTKHLHFTHLSLIAVLYDFSKSKMFVLHYMYVCQETSIIIIFTFIMWNDRKYHYLTWKKFWEVPLSSQGTELTVSTRILIVEAG